MPSVLLPMNKIKLRRDLSLNKRFFRLREDKIIKYIKIVAQKTRCCFTMASQNRYLTDLFHGFSYLPPFIKRLFRDFFREFCYQMFRIRSAFIIQFQFAIEWWWSFFLLIVFDWFSSLEKNFFLFHSHQRAYEKNRQDEHRFCGYFAYSEPCRFEFLDSFLLFLVNALMTVNEKLKSYVGYWRRINLREF